MLSGNMGERLCSLKEMKGFVIICFMWMVVVICETAGRDLQSQYADLYDVEAEPPMPWLLTTDKTLKYGPRTQRSIKTTRHGIEFILQNYGSNDSLDESQFMQLMNHLQLGPGLNSKMPKCMGVQDIYSYYGHNSSEPVNRTTFQLMCPSLVEQVVSSACKPKESTDTGSEDTGKVKKSQVWGFAVLCVTVISLASLFGAFVVPFMNKKFYRTLLLFMMSLAVGVLGGSGVFHLLPGTFGFGDDGSYAYLWKCSVIVGGIYFFFITESLMKMYIRFNDWKVATNSTDISNPGFQTEKEVKEAKDGTTDPNIAISLDSLHKKHGLDSVHVTDHNCLHEHGMDSLHMTGEHQIEKKNTMEFFVKSPEPSGLKKIAPVAWMIILGDGLHNFIDGLAIGVAFTSNVVEGISTSLAILCEELPHELGDFAILLNSGMTYKQAIACNFLSACTCYIGMIIGILLGQTTAAVKWIYALAAGMFLYISMVDMLPEATGMALTMSGTSKRETVKNFLIVNFGIVFGYVVMFILAQYSEYITV